MKVITLTQGKTALVDDQDYPELSRHKWCASKKGSAWYVHRKIRVNSGKQTTVLMHWQVMGLSQGDGLQIDRINGNGLDNRRSNLRLATQQQNNQNKRCYSKSGFKGVRRYRQKWMALIGHNGKLTHLGYFLSPQQPAAAYDRAALELFGDFARLNFSQPQPQ